MAFLLEQSDDVEQVGQDEIEFRIRTSKMSAPRRRRMWHGSALVTLLPLTRVIVPGSLVLAARTLHWGYTLAGHVHTGTSSQLYGVIAAFAHKLPFNERMARKLDIWLRPLVAVLLEPIRRYWLSMRTTNADERLAAQWQALCAWRRFVVNGLFGRLASGVIGPTAGTALAVALVPGLGAISIAYVAGIGVVMQTESVVRRLVPATPYINGKVFGMDTAFPQRCRRLIHAVLATQGIGKIRSGDEANLAISNGRLLGNSGHHDHNSHHRLFDGIRTFLHDALHQVDPNGVDDSATIHPKHPLVGIANLSNASAVLAAMKILNVSAAETDPDTLANMYEVATLLARSGRTVDGTKFYLVGHGGASELGQLMANAAEKGQDIQPQYVSDKTFACFREALRATGRTLAPADNIRSAPTRNIGSKPLRQHSIEIAERIENAAFPDKNDESAMRIEILARHIDDHGSLQLTPSARSEWAWSVARSATANGLSKVKLRGIDNATTCEVHDAMRHEQLAASITPRPGNVQMISRHSARTSQPVEHCSPSRPPSPRQFLRTERAARVLAGTTASGMRAFDLWHSLKNNRERLQRSGLKPPPLSERERQIARILSSARRTNTGRIALDTHGITLLTSIVRLACHERQYDDGMPAWLISQVPFDERTANALSSCLDTSAIDKQLGIKDHHHLSM